MRFLALIVRRLLWVAPTLFGVVLLTFTISRIIPADPAAVIAGDTATREQVAAVRAKYGFDKSMPVQFLDYLRKLTRGDFGQSLYTGRDILSDLSRRLPATLELTVAALIFTILFGIPIGVLSALKRNSTTDHIVRIITIGGLAIASFWLGIIFQLLFSMYLGWTPLNGRFAGFRPPGPSGFLVLDAIMTGDMKSLGLAISHLILPAITLGIPPMATVVRFTRAGILDVLQAPFVRYEQAMGLPPGIILWKYMLRNALNSTVTQIGLVAGALLGGSVVIEAVFDWPGIGKYAVHSILMSDYNAIMGFTVWVAVIFIAINLLVDVVQIIIDPREVTS
jgi:ABC-type dipeptide/oligopeptide/nickel transport system permease component